MSNVTRVLFCTLPLLLCPSLGAFSAAGACDSDAGGCTSETSLLQVTKTVEPGSRRLLPYSALGPTVEAMTQYLPMDFKIPLAGHQKAIAVAANITMTAGAVAASGSAATVPVTTAALGKQMPVFEFEVLITMLGVLVLSSRARSQMGDEDLVPSQLFWSFLQSPKYIALLVYLGFLLCGDLLVKREADSQGGQITLKPLLIVICIEAGKLVISFCIELLSHGQSHQTSWHDIRMVSTSLTPVALLYAVNNTLSFMLMVKTFLDTMVIWRNTNIVFSALIWMTVFGEMVGPGRLIGIFVLIIACFCSALQPSGQLSWEWPPYFILASGLLSSLASVLNERALKSPVAVHLSINLLNMLLYLQTLIFMLCTFMVSAYMNGEFNYKGLSALCYTMTSTTFAAVVAQVAVGLAISRVLKHADSVSKTMVAALKEVVIVAVGSAVVVNVHRDRVSFGATVLAAVACLLYFVPEGTEGKCKQTPEGDAKPSIPVAGADKNQDDIPDPVESSPQEPVGPPRGKGKGLRKGTEA